MSISGLGGTHFDIAIYLANRPPIDHYPILNQLQALAPGELSHIVTHTSNHWRKVFNVYSKFLWALREEAVFQSESQSSWQCYRDRRLLQHDCREALLFSPPSFSSTVLSTFASPAPSVSSPKVVHIVAGKTYAQTLDLPSDLRWLDGSFAIAESVSLIVCPYLDYRQLSNARIERLADLVRGLRASA
ncbi:MAG: hypothetical protein COA42_10990 [Alteromonadaceae bacterium]|nr:MAG: hypothetical protein COA42_10990 [Alteromonadaceae bacterium]